MTQVYQIVVIALFIILGSCTANEKKMNTAKKAPPIKRDIKIPKGIFFETGRMDIESIYVDAKWRTYCMFCDSPVRIPGYEHLTTGAMGLYMQKIEGFGSDGDTLIYPVFSCTKNDTDLIAYHLSIETKHAVYPNRIDNPIKTSLVYKKNGKPVPIMYGGSTGFSKICNWESDDLRSYSIQLRSRMLHPIQPEVISYIRKNISTIDPWFKKEAEIRGVFDTMLYSQKWVNEQIEKNRKLPKASWESLAMGHYFK